MLSFFESAARLPAWGVWVYLATCVLSGVFIGATGIGGVLLVPLLLLLDVPVDEASHIVLASLSFAGIAAVRSNWRTLPRRDCAVVGLATIPGAVVGALLFPLIPALYTSCLIAGLALLSGSQAVSNAWRAFRPSPNSMAVDDADLSTTQSSIPQLSPSATDSGRDRLQLASPDPHDAPMPSSRVSAQWSVVATRSALGLGVAVGFLSVLTATGGPFVAIPLLFKFFPHVKPALAVALAQSLCVPISLCSTCVAAAMGSVDVGFAAVVGLTIAAGVPFGVRVSHRAKPHHLRLAIGLILLAIGGSALSKVVVAAAAAGAPSSFCARFERGSDPRSCASFASWMGSFVDLFSPDDTCPLSRRYIERGDGLPPYGDSRLHVSANGTDVHCNSSWGRKFHPEIPVDPVVILSPPPLLCEARVSFASKVPENAPVRKYVDNGALDFRLQLGTVDGRRVLMFSGMYEGRGGPWLGKDGKEITMPPSECDNFWG